MIMADVLMVTLVILGFFIVTIAYWVASVGLAPEFVERSAIRFGRTPWKSLLIGLLAGLPLMVVGLAMGNGGSAVVKTVGVLLVVLVFLLGLGGSAGLCLKIGKGLPGPLDEAQPWLRVKRGGIVLGLMIIFPVLGWFVIMPAAIFMGIGAGFLAWRDGRKAFVE